MNNFWIALVIFVVVIGAALVFLGAANRRESREAMGRVELSRESRKRDKAARKAIAKQPEDRPPTGREIERLAAEGTTTELESVGAAPVPVAWAPPDPEAHDASRRAFLNRSIIALMGLGIAGFAAAAFPAFLWPIGSSGFGSKIRVGKVSEIKDEVAKGNGFLYKPEGRMWITLYPASALPKAEQVYSAPELTGMKAGLVALYQKCPHLGCRVPSCNSSQWFECPCHGSQFNQVGEKKGGPAPRGMDRFAMEVTGDQFVVNTGAVIQGPPIGTNTTGQEAEGPHCIGSTAGGH
jgi:cytochrome b6-f complex iron-sulfur subunit